MSRKPELEQPAEPIDRVAALNQTASTRLERRATIGSLLSGNRPLVLTEIVQRLKLLKTDVQQELRALITDEYVRSSKDGRKEFFKGELGISKHVGRLRELVRTLGIDNDELQETAMYSEFPEYAQLIKKLSNADIPFSQKREDGRKQAGRRTFSPYQRNLLLRCYRLCEERKAPITVTDFMQIYDLSGNHISVWIELEKRDGPPDEEKAEPIDFVETFDLLQEQLDQLGSEPLRGMVEPLLKKMYACVAEGNLAIPLEAMAKNYGIPYESLKRNRIELEALRDFYEKYRDQSRITAQTMLVSYQQLRHAISHRGSKDTLVDVLYEMTQGGVTYETYMQQHRDSAKLRRQALGQERRDQDLTKDTMNGRALHRDASDSRNLSTTNEAPTPEELKILGLYKKKAVLKAIDELKALSKIDNEKKRAKAFDAFYAAKGTPPKNVLIKYALFLSTPSASNGHAHETNAKITIDPTSSQFRQALDSLMTNHAPSSKPTPIQSILDRLPKSQWQIFQSTLNTYHPQLTHGQEEQWAKLFCEAWELAPDVGMELAEILLTPELWRSEDQLAMLEKHADLLKR